MRACVSTSRRGVVWYVPFVIVSEVYFCDKLKSSPLSLIIIKESDPKQLLQFCFERRCISFSWLSHFDNSGVFDESMIHSFSFCISQKEKEVVVFIRQVRFKRRGAGIPFGSNLLDGARKKNICWKAKRASLILVQRQRRASSTRYTLTTGLTQFTQFLCYKPTPLSPAASPGYFRDWGSPSAFFFYV